MVITRPWIDLEHRMRAPWNRLMTLFNVAMSIFLNILDFQLEKCPVTHVPTLPHIYANWPKQFLSSFYFFSLLFSPFSSSFLSFLLPFLVFSFFFLRGSFQTVSKITPVLIYLRRRRKFWIFKGPSTTNFFISLEGNLSDFFLRIGPGSFGQSCNYSHLVRMDFLDRFAAPGSVFGMVLKYKFWGFSGRKNLKHTHFRPIGPKNRPPRCLYNSQKHCPGLQKGVKSPYEPNKNNS